MLRRGGSTGRRGGTGRGGYRVPSWGRAGRVPSQVGRGPRGGLRSGSRRVHAPESAAAGPAAGPGAAAGEGPARIRCCAGGVPRVHTEFGYARHTRAWPSRGNARGTRGAGDREPGGRVPVRLAGATAAPLVRGDTDDTWRNGSLGQTHEGRSRTRFTRGNRRPRDDPREGERNGPLSAPGEREPPAPPRGGRSAADASRPRRRRRPPGRGLRRSGRGARASARADGHSL